MFNKFAIGGLELVETTLEGEAECPVTVIGGCRGCGKEFDGFVFEEVLRTGGLGTTVLLNLAVDEAVGPREKRTPGVVVGKVFPKGLEGLLDDVVGIRPVGNKGIGEGMEGARTCVGEAQKVPVAAEKEMAATKTS